MIVRVISPIAAPCAPEGSEKWSWRCSCASAAAAGASVHACWPAAQRPPALVLQQPSGPASAAASAWASDSPASASQETRGPAWAASALQLELLASAPPAFAQPASAHCAASVRCAASALWPSGSDTACPADACLAVASPASSVGTSWVAASTASSGGIPSGAMQEGQPAASASAFSPRSPSLSASLSQQPSLLTPVCSGRVACHWTWQRCSTQPSSSRQLRHPNSCSSTPAITRQRYAMRCGETPRRPYPEHHLNNVLQSPSNSIDSPSYSLLDRSVLPSTLLVGTQLQQNKTATTRRKRRTGTKGTAVHKQ